MVLAMRVTIAACSAAAAAWCVACSRRRGRTLHPQPASKQGTVTCDNEIGNQCSSVLISPRVSKAPTPATMRLAISAHQSQTAAMRLAISGTRKQQATWLWLAVNVALDAHVPHGGRVAWWQGGTSGQVSSR